MLRIFTLVLLLSGCAAPYDYAEDTDFSRFTTVALAPTADKSSLDGARIAEAAVDALPARGLTLTEPEQASLWLNFGLSEEVRWYSAAPRMLRPARYSGHYWPGYHYWDDWDEPRARPQRLIRLVLWLENPSTGKMVWRSRHGGSFPGESTKGAERSRIIEQQVTELLDNYPPRP
ncbi:DUF4136 domain-containing protein [Oceanimonas doudoroffii]|uniref:DUF4136 domain-containing protein n=1 Tax=Oceanimonas doudoroffii TaxID=84158 RepID=A0A233RBD9_9GAMM|nr:DUF4136 domain-containing protein [Oceanimonas doudoroffii]OXY80710.1 hypothetical protein B6S08_16340 [Oceanimonas doudoroffii]